MLDLFRGKNQAIQLTKEDEKEIRDRLLSGQTIEAGLYNLVPINKELNVWLNGKRPFIVETHKERSKSITNSDAQLIEQGKASKSIKSCDISATKTALKSAYHQTCKKSGFPEKDNGTFFDPVQTLIYRYEYENEGKRVALEYTKTVEVDEKFHFKLKK